MSRLLKIVGFPVTNRCNLGCKHCLRKEYSRDRLDNWDMSEPQIMHIASKLSTYTNTVNVSAGYGETFLNPQIHVILKILKEYGFKTVAYTNATTPAISNIISSEVDLLLISVDSFHLPFNMENIEFLLNYAYRINKIATSIHLNVVLNPQTVEYDVIEYVKKLCGKFHELFVEFHWLNYYTLPTHVNGITHSYYTDTFLSNDHFYSPATKYYDRNRCHDIFDALYFDERGNVRICCIHMDSSPILNIYEHTIPQILDSDYLKEQRRLFLSNNGFKFCASCPIGHGYLW